MKIFNKNYFGIPKDQSSLKWPRYKILSVNPKHICIHILITILRFLVSQLERSYLLFTLLNFVFILAYCNGNIVLKCIEPRQL